MTTGEPRTRLIPVWELFDMAVEAFCCPEEAANSVIALLEEGAEDEKYTYGPTENGKSHLLEAFAREASVPVFVVNDDPTPALSYYLEQTPHGSHRVWLLRDDMTDQVQVVLDALCAWGGLDVFTESHVAWEFRCEADTCHWVLKRLGFKVTTDIETFFKVS